MAFYRPSLWIADALSDGQSLMQKMSSADQVVADIMRGLYEGRYVAGQKLIESDLTRRYGVGRSSVREALRRLAAEGIITVSLHKGASIRSLTRQDVRDILEVIAALSGLSARLAAERICLPKDEGALQDILRSLSRLADSGDPFEFARERNRFYRHLAQISGNHELARLIPMIQSHLARIQVRAAYGTAIEKQRASDYASIVEAVLARDGSKAERLMKDHIRNAAHAIDDLPDSHFEQ